MAVAEGSIGAAESAAVRSEERLQALIAGSSDVTLVLDAAGTITFAGASVERIFGYRPEDVIGRPSSDFVHPGDLELVPSISATTIGAAAQDLPVRYRLLHRNGTWRWVDTRFTDLLDNAAVGGMVANIRDVTDQYEAEVAMQASELRYRSIVDTAEEGIWIHDLDGMTTFANPKLASSLGTTVAELERGSIWDHVDPARRAFIAAKLNHQRAGTVDQYETELVRVDGTILEVLISASPVRDAEGQVVGALKMVTDIGDRKRAEAEEARLLLVDSLTGMASRALVIDRVAQLLAHHARVPGQAAVLFLDLDNFKQVNDSLGQAAGDELLRQVATRIDREVDGQHTVGRFGGDEFVVVLDGLDSPGDAVLLAERIAVALREPIVVGDTELLVTASIGIALTPAEDATALLRDADIAMYRAKERGGARHELFDSSLRALAMARLELDRDLRLAVADDQIRVHYQPVLALDGRVVGFEALARWYHPTKGMIPPGDFIPFAESTGLIVPLGAAILDQACADLARWRALPGYEELTVAVNLSGRQLAVPGLAAAVAATLAAHALAPGALCLEITESVLMDDTSIATQALTAIHDLGVRLAVDDFGTGYSSLLYLRRFPVDALKLDRFFVAGIEQNPQDRAIVRAVIDLAHSLDLWAVAEGVETRAQLEALRHMGCDLAQGFYWSAAVPADAVESLLDRVVVDPDPHPFRSFTEELASLEGTAQERAPRLAMRSTVVLVDDSDAERNLLRVHLEASGWFRVVGEAADGPAAVRRVTETHPDLVLLDMSMPGMDGLEVLPHILRESPSTRVAVLSGYVSNGLRGQARAAGAMAVFEKGCAYASVVEQLHGMDAGPGASSPADAGGALAVPS